MSKLNIDQKSIKALFSDKKADFLMPDYQRPYAWEGRECERLWDDIFEFAIPEDEASKFDGGSEYTKRVQPEEIKVISLAWRPPVTMIVSGGHANMRPSDIVALTGERWQFTAGIYHVWAGVLANCEKWDKTFSR